MYVRRSIARLLFRELAKSARFCSTTPQTYQDEPRNRCILLRNLDKWPSDLKNAVLHRKENIAATECDVIPNLVTETEEQMLVTEVHPRLKRLRYEDSHWDDAIHLYRESEMTKWSSESEEVLQRIRSVAFPKTAKHLTHVHILDLHKDGYIKPHIDSVRYCGDVVSGVSLLSDAVMRLIHSEYKQVVIDLFLPRRSLYILRGKCRYEFTHEVLKNEESYFDHTAVIKDRRVSIICRDVPKLTGDNQSASVRYGRIDLE